MESGKASYLVLFFFVTARPQKWSFTPGEYGRSPAPAHLLPCLPLPHCGTRRAKRMKISDGDDDFHPRCIPQKHQGRWHDPLSAFCSSSNLLRANYVLSTVLNTLYVLSHLITSNIYCNLYFTDKETEAQSCKLLR